MPSNAFDVGAWSLAAGDFDADGRGDVMSSEPLDSIGATRVDFLYFDQQGELAETRPFPKLMIAPSIHQLPGDALSDVLFSEGPLGVMHGRKDRSWVPETFTSYRASDVTVRVTAVYNHRVERAAPFLPLFSYAGGAGFAGGSGFFVIDSSTGRLEERAHIAAFIPDLVGDPVSGNVFEDKQTSPCFEPVYALRGASHFTVVNTCQTDPEQGIVWRKSFEQADVALDPPAAIDAAPQYADLNNDGHLDVLVGALGKPYVAYGDGKSLASAVPYRLSLANPSDVSPDIPMPLAVADFTGDGAPDFVFSDRLLVSAKSDSSLLPVYSDAVRNRLGSPATSVQIADFNGNGKLDIVTASSNSLNVEFYNGTGGIGFTEALISTRAPVRGLSSGDFDGDGITDLALLEAPRLGERENAVEIGYGSAFARLGAPLRVAQVNQAEQLCAVGVDALSSLVVASSDEIDGQASGALTILDGSSDRVPFASFALTEFVSNGTVQDSTAIAVAAGAFTASGQGDLIALAINPPQSANATPTLNFWVAPAVEAAGAFPRRLTPALDPRLTPATFLAMNADFTADIASASADLDGDGRDEAIFVMPAGADQRQCGLLTLSVTPVLKEFVLATREPVVLDEPCADPAVVPVDADGDGSIDLAVLTGAATAQDRKLYLFWNDGTGAFSSTNLSMISGTADSPQAFSVLPARGDELPAFAYVTHDSLELVRAPASGRQFSAPVTLLGTLAGGTGIVAADVDGDRVSDLVIAESGKLRVLKAKLKLP
jgi:hypothetical protein